MIGGAIAVVLLLASLAFAVVRPRGLSEAFVAVPAAGLLLALGVTTPREIGGVIERFGPTVAFLAMILLLGHLAASAGVFRYLGARAAATSRGRPTRLLALVVVLAALVTTALTLDATIVLLTPVILSAATGLGIAPRPHLYATVRLANSASLLLPVSNLTNLLAFASAGISFGRFTALMALPWVFVCVAEWAVLRGFFRRDLRTSRRTTNTAHDAAAGAQASPRPPTGALIVVAATVAGIVVTAAVGLAPAWAAAAGSVALIVLRARQGGGAAGAGESTVPRPGELLRAASLGFCAFVLALAVLVDAALRSGLGTAIRGVIPGGSGFLALAGIAFGAALLANLVNNLPATLALVPLLTGRPEAVLAMLLGVNIGPNLTYAGSLATLLWRRLLPARHRPRGTEFHALSVAATPLILAGAVALLSVSLNL